jgi:hypothetical protein
MGGEVTSRAAVVVELQALSSLPVRMSVLPATLAKRWPAAAHRVEMQAYITPSD